jgi:sterol desaturase/sphingolipid hydroxylase (fatty acid hydroxylase superfamily)
MNRPLITLEHSRLAQVLDFVFIGAAAAALGWAAVATAKGSPAWVGGVLVGAGFLAWTLLEYLLHRYVLHGLQPFRGWHALHHQRPRARIYAPTWLGAVLFAVGILAPLWLLVGEHAAMAIGCGVVLGNLAYAVAHHQVHQPHSMAPAGWQGRRLARHRRHHGARHAESYFGVSTVLWDHVFDTARPRQVRLRYQPDCLDSPAGAGAPELARSRTLAVPSPTADRSSSHTPRKPV